MSDIMQKQATDHDLLIRLDQKFETFTKQYALDIKGLNDGITTQLAKHEVQIQGLEKRVDSIEQINNVVKPEEALKDYLKFKKDINDLLLKFTTTANAYRLIAGLVGGFIMWVITQLPNILESWGLR